MKEPINYTRLNMNDIDPEVRRIAVAWVEGFEKIGGMEIEAKVKLASDIQNYAFAYHKEQSKQLDSSEGETQEEQKQLWDLFMEDVGYQLTERSLERAKQLWLLSHNKNPRITPKP